MSLPNFPQHFTLSDDKSATSPVLLGSWCSTMDLLALITINNQLHIHRLSWEKLATIPIEKDESEDVSVDENIINNSGPLATACTWRPDGKAIAVGLRTGTINVYSLETKELAYSYRRHDTAIAVLQWLEYQPGNSPTQPKKFNFPTPPTFSPTSWSAPNITNVSLPYKEYSSLHFPPIASMASHENIDREDGVARDAEKQKCNLLWSASVDGIVVMRMYGTYEVARISINQLLRPLFIESSFPNPSNMKEFRPNSILQLAASSNFDSFSVILRSPTSTVYLASLSTPVFSSRYHEFSYLSIHAQHVSHLLGILNMSLDDLQTRWKTMRKAISLKFSPLNEVIEEYNWQSTTNDELIRLALCDIPTVPVREYITRCLSSAALIRQWTTVDATILKCIDLVRLSIQPALLHVIGRVKDLHEKSEWIGRYQVVGLNTPLLADMFENGSQLIVKAEEMLVQMLKARQSYAAFYEWMVYIVASQTIKIKYSNSTAEVEEEKDKNVYNGPFDTNQVIFCIEHELYADTSGTLIFSKDPILSPLASAYAPSQLPIGADLIQYSHPAHVLSPNAYQGVITASFLVLLDNFKKKHSQFILMSSPVVSAGIELMNWTIGSNDKLIHLFDGRDEERIEYERTDDENIEERKISIISRVFDSTQKSISLHYDTKTLSYIVTFVMLHPILRHPVITLINYKPQINPSSLYLVYLYSPLSHISSSSFLPSFFCLSCPAAVDASASTVLSIHYNSPSSILILIRYDFHRRSSELKLLAEKQKMIGNVLTRLWQIDYQNNKIWTPVKEEILSKFRIRASIKGVLEREDYNTDTLSLPSLSSALIRILDSPVTSMPSSINRLTSNQSGISLPLHSLDSSSSSLFYHHRIFLGLCGRDLILGAKRGVCAVLTSAVLPYRVKQHMKRVILLDITSHGDEEQVEDDTVLSDSAREDSRIEGNDAIEEYDIDMNE